MSVIKEVEKSDSDSHLTSEGNQMKDVSIGGRVHTGIFKNTPANPPTVNQSSVYVPRSFSHISKFTARI